MKKRKNIGEEYKKKAIISVIMSTYNESLEYINIAVDSILNQSYKNIEFIILVDNPDRKELIEFMNQKKKSDSRIKVLVNSANIGLTASLNKGLSVASGDYVARMDADDISKNDRLETQLKLLEDTGLDLVGCNVEDIDANGRETGRITNLPTTDKDIKEYLKIDSALLHPTWLAKKSVFDDNLYVDFPACEDYELLTRLALQGKKFGNVKIPKLYYRMNNDGISSTRKVQQKTSKYFVMKNYKKGIISDLDNYKRFVSSAKGIKKQKSLTYYYNIMSEVKKDFVDKKYSRVVVGALLLFLFSGEAKLKIINMLRKKIISKRRSC